MSFLKGLNHALEHDNGETFSRRLKENPNVDVNTFRTHGRHTLLEKACFSGSWDCVRVLLEAGASPNIHTLPRLPIVFCIHNTQSFILMLDYGSRMAIINNKYTLGHVFNFAHSKQKYDICKLMIDRGKQPATRYRKESYGPVIKTGHRFRDDMYVFVRGRHCCRRTAVIVASMTRNHGPVYIRNQDKNVLRLVAKHVWSTRIGEDEEWQN